MTGISVQLVHTADLDPATLAVARALLDDVFAGELTDHDWEHGLGGLHALAWHGGELVGHASVVQRRLLHARRALRCGYVEAVGVRTDHRRQGYAAAMMAELERIIRLGYDLGALGSTDEALPFYLGRGWRPWAGPLWALTPSGVVRTHEEDGFVFVFPGSIAPDLTGDLTADWRDGDVW